LPADYAYTFDQLAETMAHFLDVVKINRYSLYINDYGAPIGFRIMVANLDQLHALITQNGNAYRDGLGAKWENIARYWANPQAHPEVLDAFLSFEATKQHHMAGTSHLDRFNPDTWTDEYSHLSRPGQREIQTTLLYDYPNNIASYPTWQAWMREHKPPTLVVWGANDPSFTTPGTEASKRDLPDAEVYLLDAGHFALGKKSDEIALLILDFMARHPD
jgi:pimeloyl-ACP methyl ester carboxylesterase